MYINTLNGLEIITHAQLLKKQDNRDLCATFVYSAVKILC